jgi:Xaa-Pro aminopeptidase
MDRAYFITDFRYKDQSKSQVRIYEKLIAIRRSLVDLMSERGILDGIGRVGFEAEYVNYLFILTLRRKFKGVKFVPVKGFIGEISAIKTPDEIANIRKAIKISERVYEEILKIIKPGISELDISAEISYLHKKFGAEGDAFDIIVASGWRGSLPHGVASSKKIKQGELVIIDFGCIYNGYHSDITRTLGIGKLSSEAKKIYQIVLDAQLMAIENVRTGIEAGEIDSIARRYIRKNGYGRYFGHSLGHGLGIETHTLPRISPGSRYILKDGNVITIEPGIYIPEFGGVRIEDDILVKDSTYEIMTGLPKNLIIL